MSIEWKTMYLLLLLWQALCSPLKQVEHIQSRTLRNAAPLELLTNYMKLVILDCIMAAINYFSFEGYGD